MPRTYVNYIVCLSFTPYQNETLETMQRVL